MAEPKNQMLRGDVSLSRLVHVVMEKTGKDKKTKIKGLFIPIENNLLREVKYESQGREVVEYVIPVSVLVRPETDAKGQDGFIKKELSNELYKSSTEEQREEWKTLLPFLGNLKDFSRGSGGTNQSQNVAPDTTYAEDDDLPF